MVGEISGALPVVATEGGVAVIAHILADAALLRECLTHERSDRRRTCEPALNQTARQWLMAWADRLERFVEDHS